jgi:chromosome partitioning protein
MNPSTKISAFVHQKGGTGKTTACLNIAGCLAKQHQKVLVVDLDPQCSATSGLGLNRDQ